MQMNQNNPKNARRTRKVSKKRYSGKNSKKRGKNRLSKKQKKNIWKSFDNENIEKGEEADTIESKQEDLIDSYVNEHTICQREKCDICECSVAYSEERFLVCTNNKCGVIYKDVLDESPEWRYYGAGDNKTSDPTRCGMPINPLLKESSYGCKVFCGGRSSYEMRKIRRYTEWQSMPYKEKAQYNEYQKIKALSHSSGIPKIIVDDALRYHKQISELKTFRGCNRNGILAASIYISCRKNSYPRTAKEIAVIFHLDITSATKGCKNAIHILNNIERDSVNTDKTFLCETRVIDFIERYCSKLSINKELTKLCQFIALKIEQNNIMPENTPHSVAAGIVYFVTQSCNLNVSKKEVAGFSEISEVTINKCFKKLQKIQNKIIPSIVLERYKV